MKFGMPSIVCVVAVLWAGMPAEPLRQQGPQQPGPQAQAPDAGAAVAVQRAVAQPVDPGLQAGSVVLLVSGAGKMTHLEGGPSPGQKPFTGPIKSPQISACIMGTAIGCVNGVSVEADDGGLLYLFFDSVFTWRLATNPNGDDATTLTGLVDGKGGFVMGGAHALSGTQMLLTGKVVFEKGNFNPKKLSGKFTAVSTDNEHYGSGKFKAAPMP